MPVKFVKLKANFKVKFKALPREELATWGDCCNCQLLSFKIVISFLILNKFSLLYLGFFHNFVLFFIKGALPNCVSFRFKKAYIGPPYEAINKNGVDRFIRTERKSCLLYIGRFKKKK